MKVGDQIIIRFLASKHKARLTYVEKYQSAYIISYRFQSGQTAIATVFPDLTYLPGYSVDSEMYQPPCAFIEWEDHIWPVPIGVRPTGSRLIKDEDALLYAKRRVDWMLMFLQEFMPNAQMEINPGSDEEHALWKKWWGKG